MTGEASLRQGDGGARVMSSCMSTDRAHLRVVTTKIPDEWKSHSVVAQLECVLQTM